MAEIDYIKFEGNQAYLDTDMLDECFFRLGGLCNTPYSEFGYNTKEGYQHIDINKIKKAFAEADAHRMRSDRLLSEEARSRRALRSIYLDVDAVPKTARLQENLIMPYRLVHSKPECGHNKKDSIRLYFNNNEQANQFLCDGIETMSLTPCPYCTAGTSMKDVEESIRYSEQYGKMIPCSKYYALNIPWMDVKKERKAQRRRQISTLGYSIWGALLEILFLLLATPALYYLMNDLGFAQKLMGYSEKLLGFVFGYATGTFPALLSGSLKFWNYGKLGREMLTSTDPKILFEGMAWLSFSMSTALLIGFHTFYDGWLKKRWHTFFLMYPVYLVKGILAACIAVPFPLITIPIMVLVIASVAGRWLSAHICPRSACAAAAGSKLKGGGGQAPTNYSKPGKGGNSFA